MDILNKWIEDQLTIIKKLGQTCYISNTVIDYPDKLEINGKNYYYNAKSNSLQCPYIVELMNTGDLVEKYDYIKGRYARYNIRFKTLNENTIELKYI